MCQTHSKLIDSDTTTYSVEKLKKWKADAEKLAADALANSDYISEYYKSNGNNLEILKCLFDDMIVEGEFTKLKTMLDQYTTSLSEKYEEFILRYKIIYDVYCSSANGITFLLLVKE